MSRPTHILKHEHRVIEQALRALDGVCLKLRTGDSVPDEAFLKLLDFLRNFAIRFHHLKEEQHLFPALKQLGVRDDGGALGFLRGEHELEQRLLADLELVIDELRHGDPAAIDRFVEAATGFRDHMIGHMQQEDATLFALVEEMLDETAKHSLHQALSRDDGDQVRYELMAMELENEWAV